MEPTPERLAHLQARLRRESRALAYWSVTAIVSVVLFASAVVLHLLGG